MSSDSEKSKHDPLSPFLKSMGEDCDRPACDDTKSALTAALGRVNAAKKKAGEKQPVSYRACPPTRDELGVSTWTLVHSMVRESLDDLVSTAQIPSIDIPKCTTLHSCTYRQHGIQINQHHKIKSSCRTLCSRWLDFIHAHGAPLIFRRM